MEGLVLLDPNRLLFSQQGKNMVRDWSCTFLRGAFHPFHFLDPHKLVCKNISALTPARRIKQHVDRGADVFKDCLQPRDGRT